MFNLTGSFLLHAAVVAAVLGPIVLVVWSRRSTRGRWGRSLLQWIAVGSCQVVAWPDCSFSLLMVLHGQPSTPQATFRHFEFGRQDDGSYRSTRRFLAASHGDPDVSSLIFGTGGHHYRNYRNDLPATLAWLQTKKAFT